MKKIWYANEVEKLKRCYLKEQSLRDMSFALGRSVTAVNKALTRFKIRPYKPLPLQQVEKAYLLLSQYDKEYDKEEDTREVQATIRRQCC